MRLELRGVLLAADSVLCMVCFFSQMVKRTPATTGRYRVADVDHQSYVEDGSVLPAEQKLSGGPRAGERLGGGGKVVNCRRAFEAVWS